MPRQVTKLTIVKKHFEVLKKTDKFDLLQSQGCCFQYLIRGQEIYYYFHSWYSTYSKAFIAYYKIPLVSDQHAKLLNVLIYDYDVPEEDQVNLTPEEISDNLEENESLRQFEETVYGKNCLMTYRVYHDKKTPSDITGVQILENPKNVIFLKKDCRIPRQLLPGGIELSQPKKTMKEVLEETRAKKLLKKHIGGSLS